MSALIDPVSLCTVKIAAIDQSGSSHPATGFLYSSGDQEYVVTNWHVLTGRNPANRQNSKTGSLVTHLEVAYHWSDDQKRFAPYRSTKDTYEILDTATMKGSWIEHSDSEIDVAMLPIKTPENALKKTINKIGFKSDFEPGVAEDIFVVGFPNGLNVPATTLPLWKGGSIANDPAIPIGQKPRNLIDCDTYEGMSGSPVIARRQSGLFRHDDKGHMRSDSVFGEVRQFFGVYSGRVRQRIGDAYETTKFGVVWSSAVVEEILKSPHPGCILR